MPGFFQTCRVAIAGASSLRGKELCQLVDESGFPAADIRLLDEEIVVGTLTEAGGEPTFIQAVDEDSFDNVRFAFFVGTPAFTARHWQAAQRAGATVIDLTGALAGEATACRWIPALDVALPPVGPANGRAFLAASAPALVACTLAAALARFAVKRLAVVFFQPVSERGQAGIDELESQTVKLLSFQPIPLEVFDTQVAFNLVDRYGEASAERLDDIRERIAREVCRFLAGRAVVPAIQLIQAPVFYSLVFTAYAELGSPPACGDEPEALRDALEAVGARVAVATEPAPSNVSVAGETRIVLGHITRDLSVARGYWLWGAADDLRVVAAHALQIAERLLAS